MLPELRKIKIKYLLFHIRFLKLSGAGSASARIGPSLGPSTPCGAGRANQDGAPEILDRELTRQAGGRDLVLAGIEYSGPI